MEVGNDYAWIKPYLNGYECILWRGTPLPGRLLSKKDFIMMPFSFVWCSFAIFIETTLICADSPLFAKLFVVPFVLIGLYISIGRFFYMAYLRKRTTYIITNKKIIRKRGKTVDILSGAALSQMQIHAHADGSGTIDFGETYHLYRRSASWSDSSTVFQLVNIENVNHVQQLIQCRYYNDV